MNADVQKLWVAALRSNTYQQGKGQLRDGDDKYCCLGVLCELYRRENGGEWLWDWDSFIFMDATSSRSAHSLPDDVARWADLQPDAVIADADHLLGGDDPLSGDSFLAHMNDEGVSFQEIADIIEKVALEPYPS